MAETFDVGNLCISLHTAPPVYAPGGQVALANETDAHISNAVIAAAEAEAARHHAVLLMMPCKSEQANLQGRLEQRGYRAASAWFRGPTRAAMRLQSTAVRRATADDVPALLTIGEEARRQKARYSPVFWKMTTSPKETFAPYVTMQVDSERNVAFVHEEQGMLTGYCIVQNDYVDDFAVEAPELWATVGRELLHAASNAAHERTVSQLIIVAPDGDTDKCDAIIGEGFVRFRRWYVKPLETVGE